MSCDDVELETFSLCAKKAFFHLTPKAFEECSKYSPATLQDANSFWETNQLSKLNRAFLDNATKCDKALSDMNFRVYIDIDSNMKHFTLVSMEHVSDLMKPICFLFGPVKTFESSISDIKAIKVPNCKVDGKPLWMEKTLDLNLMALRRSSAPNCYLKETIIDNKLCLGVYLLPEKTLKPKEPIYVSLKYGSKPFPSEEATMQATMQALMSIETTLLPPKRKQISSQEPPAKKPMFVDMDGTKHLKFIHSLNDSLAKLSKFIADETKKEDFGLLNEWNIREIREIFRDLKETKSLISQIEQDRKSYEDLAKKWIQNLSDQASSS